MPWTSSMPTQLEREHRSSSSKWDHRRREGWVVEVHEGAKTKAINMWYSLYATRFDANPGPYEPNRTITFLFSCHHVPTSPSPSVTGFLGLLLNICCWNRHHFPAAWLSSTNPTFLGVRSKHGLHWGNSSCVVPAFVNVVNRSSEPNGFLASSQLTPLAQVGHKILSHHTNRFANEVPCSKPSK
jgi:hypothetical protein